jgi:hypothetical protein
MLAADGFEQSELIMPKRRLKEAGAKVDIISLKAGEIWGWEHDDWGDPIPVDRTIDAVQVDEYDALVIPGGQINPDLLRADEDAVTFVKDFYDSGREAGCGGLSCPLGPDRSRPRQGPQDDLVPFHGDRREERRGPLGRPRSGGR